jgi:hypothetical protein
MAYIGNDNDNNQGNIDRQTGVAKIKMNSKVKIGDIIVLKHIDDKFTRLTPGMMAEVKSIDNHDWGTQIRCNFENGVKIALLDGIDIFEVVKPK